MTESHTILLGFYCMSKKVQVSFSDKQITLLNELKGEFGNSEAEVVRAIVIAWLAEKGLLQSSVESRLRHLEEEHQATVGFKE